MDYASPVASPAEGPTLIGRDDDLDLLRRAVMTKPVAGGALVVTGDPGIGKSVLLDTLAREAREAGCTVVRVTGVQFEADVSYSGLSQLVLPLSPQLDRLSPPHRDALLVATGMGCGQAPERLVVSTAALLLLRGAAEAAPVLMVVDDVPWLDRASAGVFGFVARRLAGSGVGFLAAARSESDGYFDRRGLPEHRLGPLSEESAYELLRVTHPRLAVEVRRRIVETARGNPLALVELPQALSGPQQIVGIDLPAFLPLGERLKALFAARVADLPSRCRRALLLAALDGTGDVTAVETVAGPSFVSDLAWAERARVVVVDLPANRLAFHHPLLASAVVDSATSGERRDAHLMLAEACGAHPERRAWHLAEAAAMPDEAVARQLEAAAGRIMARGDAAGAIAALARAAQLSPVATDRSRRLAKAAYIGADAAGVLPSASTFLHGAQEVDPAQQRSLFAATAAAHLLINNDGMVETAHSLVADAVASHLAAAEPNDHAALAEALHTLLLLCWYSGRAELWRPLIDAVDELGDAACELLWLICKTFGDPARTGAEAMERLERALRAAPHETDPTRVIRLGTATVFADRQEDVREGCWRVVRQGRRGQSPARRHITALLHLCTGNLFAGRWEETDLLAKEGLEICATQGYRFFVWYFLYVQAYLAALRGDTEANHALTEHVKRWATVRGARGAALLVTQTRALAALGAGDAEEAYRQSCLISAPGELAAFMPVALWNAIDLVEAAMRTGRAEEARRHALAVRASQMAAVSPRMSLNVLVIEALTEPDAGLCDRRFQEALSAPQAHRWPFDIARAELLYGEHLRRTRRISEARARLASALSGFQAIGAALWAQRAATELRAAGQNPPRTPRTASTTALTPQEREIAVLAAAGLTNRQIAERLFLSHRTVGFHLYQLYPKLGITTRAALRDALSAIDQQ